jgi:cytidylate kinase
MSTNQIDLSPFPNNTGQILDYIPNQIDQTNLQISKKTIIRLYGTVGSGKGTLANNLMSTFDLTNFETSYILRSCTWIYEHLGLVFGDNNTKNVYSQLEIRLQNKSLTFFWRNQQLTNTELRSNAVDQKVSIYSGNPYFRSLYYDKINYILNNLATTAVILDGRGSNTPYLNMAEQEGFKVIRFFLWVNSQVSYQRFLSRLGIAETEANKQELQSNFIKNVINRDLQDYNNIITNNLGTISPDTGIIDTSDLNPQQVLKIAINFINSNLKM